MGFWRCEQVPPSQGAGCAVGKGALSLQVFVLCVMPVTRGVCRAGCGGKQGGGSSQALQSCMHPPLCSSSGVFVPLLLTATIDFFFFFFTVLKHCEGQRMGWLYWTVLDGG